MQLEQVIFTLSQHSQGSPHEDIGAVLCQHHVNHPACKGGWEGTAVDGQEPLGSIQHWHCSIVLQIAWKNLIAQAVRTGAELYSAVPAATACLSHEVKKQH